MFTNEWPLELDELFTGQNLFSEFSTVIVWQLSPGQTDYYKCVITAIRQWLFLWIHFSLWITDKQFILTIHHPTYVTGHLGCTVLFLLHDWVTVASWKRRMNYDRNNKHLISMFKSPLLPAKWDFCCERKEKKIYISQAFVGGKNKIKKQQQTYLNTFSWKINPKGHWQGHSECEIIRFWWTLTVPCHFVRREALYIHNLEFLPNWKSFPHMALNI